MRYNHTIGPCPGCNGIQTRFNQHQKLPISPWQPVVREHRESGDRVHLLRLLVCPSCGTSVTLHETVEGPAEQVLEQVVVFPEMLPRELDPAAPDEVRGAYREASVCESAGAMRAAGVMYRAAVEAMLKDVGAEGANLYARINSLSASGVAQPVIDDMHQARLLGNDSIHDLLAFSAEEVADVAELIEEAVLVIYQQPAKRRDMRARRDARRAGSASPGTTP